MDKILSSAKREMPAGAPRERDVRVGLVLAGGMAKGAYQIGVLKALEEFIPRSAIQCVSAASIGVLNGFAYVTGQLPRAEEMWRGICGGDKSLLVSKVLRSGMLQNSISALRDISASLPIPFYCSLLDYTHRKIVYRNLTDVKGEDLLLYLKASVAMPICNRAVKVKKTAYFDGALVDNIPVYPMMKHESDYLISVYFDDVCYRFENKSFNDKVIKLSFPGKGGLKKSLLFSPGSIDDMICEGYERAQERLKTLLGADYRDVDAVREAIAAENEPGKGEPFRVTVDVVASQLNKVSQKLFKKVVS